MPRPSARPPKIIPVPEPPKPKARANAPRAKSGPVLTAPAVRAIAPPVTELSAKKAAATAVPTAASVKSHQPAKPPTPARILPSTASKGAARQSRHAKTPIAEGSAAARPVADPPKQSARKRVLPPPVSTQPNRRATSKPAAAIARPLPPRKESGTNSSHENQISAPSIGLSARPKTERPEIASTRKQGSKNGIVQPPPPKSNPAPIVSTSKKRESPAAHLKPRRKALRIVDLGRPHNTNTQDGALLYALHILSGADAIWEPLKLTGPTDAELERAAEDYFPVLLGYNSERQKGFTIGRKSQPYFIWGTGNAAGRRLEGPFLIQKIRAILCLPDRTNKP